MSTMVSIDFVLVGDRKEGLARIRAEFWLSSIACQMAAETDPAVSRTGFPGDGCQATNGR